MTAPGEFERLEPNADGVVTDIELIDSVSNNYLMCRKEIARLKGFQLWVRSVK